MPIADDELAYEYHLEQYRRMGLLQGGSEAEEFFRVRAAEMHSYAIKDALLALLQEAHTLSGGLETEAARTSLQFGAGRRLKIVWQSIRDLQSVAPADRREPMKQSEVDIAARALNDFYLHALGLLDNYAHAVGWELIGERLGALRDFDLSLFREAYLRACDSSELRTLVEPYRQWEAELKKLRHPVAHRIPLTVPPTVITKAQVPDHEAAWAAYWATALAPPATDAPNWAELFKDWEDRRQRLLDRAESIGEFQPWIAHDPRASVVPIYPTILDDGGKLIALCRALNHFLRSQRQA